MAGRQRQAALAKAAEARKARAEIKEKLKMGSLTLKELMDQGAGNETVGKPSRPDFLLAPGELLQAYGGELRVVAFEDGFLDAPARYVQRIAAVRETTPGARHPL